MLDVYERAAGWGVEPQSRAPRRSNSVATDASGGEASPKPAAYQLTSNFCICCPAAHSRTAAPQLQATMKKTIAMHEERDKKHKADDGQQGSAVPAYLLEREQVC